MYETFDQGGVSEYGIAQCSIWQPCDHRNLDRGHDLPSGDSESSEAQNAIAVSFDQCLHKAARFRKRARAQVGFHWDLEEPIWNAVRLRFGFTQADMSEFWICK